MDTGNTTDGHLRIAFARWQSAVPSGGNRYDDALVAGLAARGIEVREYAITGSWPYPSRQDRERLRELLVGDSARAEHYWLIDNIVGSAVPEILRASVLAGRTVAMIMHYFAADEHDQTSVAYAQLSADEADAVNTVNVVIATSRWAANQVASRYGRADVTVAVPGVLVADIATGSLQHGRPPTLLWLARLTRTKDPLTFITALARVQDVSWRAHLVGPDTIDPVLTAEVKQHIARAGLSSRIAMPGALVGRSLQEVWEQTDLLVHTARSEAYGMVVTEALARGIPSLVPVGTGAAEAQQSVGAVFASGDSEALAGMIRSWLTEADLQQQWKAEAIDRRAILPSWEDTARVIANALTRDISTR